MVNIYLDDNRHTPPGFLRAFTVEECITLLVEHRGNVGTLSLDNDLGIPGLENEGREIVKELARYLHEEGVNLWPNVSILIHSANPVARDYMAGTIVRYGPGFAAKNAVFFERRGR